LYEVPKFFYSDNNDRATDMQNSVAIFFDTSGIKTKDLCEKGGVYFEGKLQ
jgi:hypothetical protein